MAALSLYDIKRILNPRKIVTPEDDFRIIDSWTEYEKNERKTPEERNLEFLCYELEVMNPETGEITRFFKAIKFARVIRIPAGVRQSTSLMDMQTDILAGLYQQECDFITVIANIIKPEPIGLLFLYGIQGVSTNIDEAKERCSRQFAGFVGAMTAAFRVLEFKCLEAREAEWLKEKMAGMDYLTMVRGIPFASKSGEDAGNKGLGGKNLNPDSEGTLEELIIGMADYEYVVEILSTPVYQETLTAWHTRSYEEMTAWSSHLQGQTSFSFNLSIPMMYMANASQSQGWNKGYTDASTVSFAQGESFSVTEGESIGRSLSEAFSNSYSHGVSETFGETEGISVGESYSQTESLGVSQTEGISKGFSIGQSSGLTYGQSENHSFTNSEGQSSGISENIGQSSSQGSSQTLSRTETQTLGESHGTSIGNTYSQGTNYGTSYGQSSNVTNGITHNTSQGISQGNTVSEGQNWGTSEQSSRTDGTSGNISYGNTNTSGNTNTNSSNLSYGDGFSKTYGESESSSESEQKSNSFSAAGYVGFNSSDSESESWGTSESETTSQNITLSSGSSSGTTNSNSYSETVGSGHSQSVTNGSGISQGGSYSQSENLSQTFNEGFAESESVSNGITFNESFGASETLSESTTTSDSVSMSNGVSEGLSYGVNQSVSDTHSMGQTYGVNSSSSTSEGTGTSVSENIGVSSSQNVSQSSSSSVSQTIGNSYGQNISKSSSSSHSLGTTDSVSEGQTKSYGSNTTDSKSISNGTSNTVSEGTSKSISTGTSGTSTLGTSSTMGLGPSIGYNKSHQWKNQGVQDLLELLEFQNERIKKAIRKGAFYTYVYIACPSIDALSTAQTVAKAAWHNEYALTQPVQVLNLSETEQEHLLGHFAAFSADVTKEDFYGGEEYKYGTPLCVDELNAYTHLPRVSEGGVYATVDDIPKFAAPSGLKGPIHIGTVVNPERYTFYNGYLSQFDYRISEDKLMHAYFAGASRSGKTEAAKKYVVGCAKIMRRKTGKRLRIVVMDPKQDWRILGKYVPEDRFNFYSLANPKFCPLYLNVWKVPKGVHPQIWVDGVIDIYCRAYGLMERGKQVLGEIIYGLYNEAGVFEANDRDDWEERVPELSSKVNFCSIYRAMKEKRDNIDNGPGGKAGFDTKDALDRLLERLSCFSRPYSIESRLYGTSEGVGIDDLIGNDDITVLESKGLERTFSGFIFGTITSGFFKYAIANEGGYFADDQYETMLVIEEANEVLTSDDKAGNTNGRTQSSLPGPSEFELILDQAAGYGLYITAITQKIADMPKSVVANAGIIFEGRMESEDDIFVSARAIGRDGKLDDKDVSKWLSRSNQGWFVVKTAKVRDFKEAEPVLVSVTRLEGSTPTNKELKDILTTKKALKMQKIV